MVASAAHNDWRKLILDRFGDSSEMALGPKDVLESPELYVAHAYEVLAVFERLEDEGYLFREGAGTWKRTTKKL